MALRRSLRLKKLKYQNLCEDYSTDSEEEDYFRSKYIVVFENRIKNLQCSNNCSTKGRPIDSSEGYALRKWKEEEKEEEIIELEEMFLNLKISNTKQKYITNEGYESEYDYSIDEYTTDEDITYEVSTDDDTSDDYTTDEDCENEDSYYKKIDYNLMNCI